MNRKKKSTNCLKKYYIKIDKLSKFAIFKLRRRFNYTSLIMNTTTLLPSKSQLLTPLILVH